MPVPRKATFSTLGVTLCATALVGGLAGTATAGDDNGIADKSVEEISRESRAAFLGVSSLHVEADIRGMPEPAPASFELSYDTKENCVGTVTNQKGKGSMEVLRKGDRVWIKPDEQWIASQMPQLKGNDAAELLKGKYFGTTVKNPDGAKIAQLCDLNSFKQQITTESGKAQNATVEKGERTKVDGRPAIELKVQRNMQEGTTYISTEGKPYPLRVEANDTAKGVEVDMTFSEFDKPVTVKIPTDEQSVDID